MVLIGLLIIALVSVLLGIVLGSVTWLVVSLVASVLAALVLYRSWRTIKERRTDMPLRRSKSGKKAAPVTAGPGQVLVVDGRPDYHRTGCGTLTGADAEAIPLSQAVEDGFRPCAVCKPETLDAAPAAVADAPTGSSDVASGGQVWVADGYPEYHVQGCAELAGLASEAIPHDQAVEDGFQPCVVCNPERGESPAAAPGDVWVVDGRADYHLAGCATLSGLPAEPVPHAQAVEDGFTPCAVCDPEPARVGVPAGVAAAETTVLPAVSGAPSASGAPSGSGGAALAAEPAMAGQPAAEATHEVWVADGYPDFHRAGCHELNGLESEPVPYRQAVEDGFAACPVCRPDGTEPAAAGPSGPAGGEVWVVDGFPDYHRAGCTELTGLPAEPVPHEQAVEDGFAACAVCRPEAQAADQVEGEAPGEPSAAPASATEPAEPETGLELVTAAAPQAVTVPEADTETRPAEVWVVDGYPDFHRPGCPELAGLDAEPIPFDQAVEDDFQPCEQCRPHVPDATVPDHSAVAASEPEPQPTAEVVPEPEPEPVAEVAPEPEPEPEPEPVAQATPEPEPEPEPVAEVAQTAPEPVVTQVAPEPVSVAGEPLVSPTASGSARRVWVVDGRPRYHAEDCLIIKGQRAQPVLLDEAVGDGFMPCSLCQRDH